ncbi:hypothetical protein C4577_02305 [Candidatus Parcubacteria bacterium]|nr:MAG: hypothetical protein C4577_02305 [Candidatus Parcubacteria bacterium]
MAKVPPTTNRTHEDKTDTIGYSRELKNPYRRFPSGRVDESISLLVNPGRQYRGRLYKSTNRLQLDKRNPSKSITVANVASSPFQKAMNHQTDGGNAVEFIPYTGKRGGTGCLNTATGKVSYGDPTKCEVPTGEKEEEEKPKPRQRKMEYPKHRHKPVSGEEELISTIEAESDYDLYKGAGKYKNPVQFIVSKGKRFKGSPLAATLIQGEQSNCFVNATRLVLANPDYNYAEGFVKEGANPPVLHAWAVTKEGRVVDNTLENPGSASYIGVVFPRQQYLQYISKNKYYGVLGGNKDQAEEVLRKGGIS